MSDIDKLREWLRRDSVPYYEIPSVEGSSNWAQYVDPDKYRESAEVALERARRYSE